MKSIYLIGVMRIIKEPKNVDLSTKSEPWTKQELIDFRKIMQENKSKKVNPKPSSIKATSIKKELS